MSIQFELLGVLFKEEREMMLKKEKEEDAAYQPAVNFSSHQNVMVKEELETARKDSKVFKLVGPALPQQTMEEATAIEDRRMEIIGEIIKNKPIAPIVNLIMVFMANRKLMEEL